jgi:hypothetical protein
MDTFANAVVALGSGIPDGVLSGILGVAPSLAEIVAGLGALVVATLGVLVVRHLQAADASPEPVPTPDPAARDIQEAA